jgi:hypothetical protein
MADGFELRVTNLGETPGQAVVEVEALLFRGRPEVVAFRPRTSQIDVALDR